MAMPPASHIIRMRVVREELRKAYDGLRKSVEQNLAQDHPGWKDLHAMERAMLVTSRALPIWGDSFGLKLVRPEVADMNEEMRDFARTYPPGAL